ncbi:MAG: DUF4860 domain-containing protein [Clostridia bacterium]|nr:DUF4860 domain-containing protein [Clostridia bacterium]
MRSSNGSGGSHVSLLFVILLFFMLALCTLFTILTGARGYENMQNRSETLYKEQTALAYISNKVRQNDSAGGVFIQHIDGENVLVLEQLYGTTMYHSYVFYDRKTGTLRELFCEKESELGPSNADEILECDPLSFSMPEKNLLCVKLESTNPKRLYLNLRCGSGGEELE